ncbi:aspartate aminotransferase family protein [Cocleimonas flava]|uniref:Acetylornithine aminotransferase n=1 Tax=Cocleimonas flava TaxID=634765 RepID=A0A4R1F2Q3_9GAMM|nr:aspartate aminotransferase family protein [Cocleimonas flava]TCJ88456.1 acetylornithine aminotransferase [Cocleimonas flava]
MSDSLMSTYARLPVSFEKGEGVYLYDTEGNKYLDALAGIAVCSLGHAHPRVAEAIADQARTLIHTSNVYNIPHQTELGDKLCGLSGMSRVFFGNSGAEANEAAIKIARLFGKKQGIDRPKIIVASGSFHGRTLATLSATGSRKVQAGFSPLVEGFVRVDYNDLEAIEKIAENSSEVAAILVEPVQGEGGIIVPDEGYLSSIRKICDDNNWLMMLDEIQTGMGRTGKMFAFQHEGITPDVMTLAKALGNGVPIGACLAAGKAEEIFTPGTHGSTFGGNPLVTRTALEVLSIMEEQDIPAKAAEMGSYMLTQFKQALADVDGVIEIRGHGLMIGINLNTDCGELVSQALEKKLLINVTAGKTVRLLPPLIITKEQADEVISTLVALIKDFL